MRKLARIQASREVWRNGLVRKSHVSSRGIARQKAGEHVKTIF
jgi:hypothetical protein